MDVVEAAPVAVRRRAHAALPRHCQVVLRFSDEERTLIRAAARAGGLAVGAWLGDLAVRAAATGTGSSPWGLGISRAEVLGALVRARLDVSLALRVLQAEADSDPDSAHATSVRDTVSEVARLIRATLARLDALIDRTVEDDPNSQADGPG
jgi:hypothetical protein